MKNANTTPKAVSPKWCLLYVLVLAIVAAVLAWGYDKMPDVIPIHTDFRGEVNDWIPKGPQVFTLPLGVISFLALCMTFCQWTMAREKRPTGLGDPESSDWAFGMAMRAQSITLLISGLLLSLVMGVTIALSMMGFITLLQAGVAICFVAGLMVVACVIVSIIYGNAGSKLHRRIKNGEELPLVEPESHWRGIVYVNREDPHVMVPKRYGIGWTLNFGHRGAWVFLIVLTLATLAFVGLLMLE